MHRSPGSLAFPASCYIATGRSFSSIARIPAGDARRKITVRHLMSMSSGLPSTSISNYGAWVSSRDWNAYTLNRPLAHPPARR